MKIKHTSPKSGLFGVDLHGHTYLFHCACSYNHIVFNLFWRNCFFPMQFFIWYAGICGSRGGFYSAGVTDLLMTLTINILYHFISRSFKAYTNVGSGFAIDFCVHKITFCCLIALLRKTSR